MGWYRRMILSFNEWARNKPNYSTLDHLDGIFRVEFPPGDGNNVSYMPRATYSYDYNGAKYLGMYFLYGGRIYRLDTPLYPNAEQQRLAGGFRGELQRVLTASAGGRELGTIQEPEPRSFAKAIERAILNDFWDDGGDDEEEVVEPDLTPPNVLQPDLVGV